MRILAHPPFWFRQADGFQRLDGTLLGLNFYIKGVDDKLPQ